MVTRAVAIAVGFALQSGSTSELLHVGALDLSVGASRADQSKRPPRALRR